MSARSGSFLICRALTTRPRQIGQTRRRHRARAAEVQGGGGGPGAGGEERGKETGEGVVCKAGAKSGKLPRVSVSVRKMKSSVKKCLSAT